MTRSQQSNPFKISPESAAHETERVSSRILGRFSTKRDDSSKSHPGWRLLKQSRNCDKLSLGFVSTSMSEELVRGVKDMLFTVSSLLAQVRTWVTRE